MGILDGIALGGGLTRRGNGEKAALQLLEITDKMAAELSRTRAELDRVLLAQVIPQEVRRRVANHVSGDALDRVYVHHSYDDEAREAWARWGAHLEGLSSQTGNVVALKGLVS